MKLNFSKIVVGLLSLNLLLAPAASFAAASSTDHGTKTHTPGAAFCKNIDAASQKIEAAVASRTDKIAANKNARAAKLQASREARDQALNTARAARDAQRDAHITTLTGKANTDAKKAAVTTFKTAINTAVSARRTSVDAAIKTFRTGVDALIAGKFATLDTGVTTYKAAVDSAIATAKTSCAGGTDSATVRSKMKASIEAARTAFKATRTDAQIKDDIKQLADARKVSIDASIAQFKTDVAKAQADLKAAFK